MGSDFAVNRLSEQNNNHYNNYMVIQYIITNTATAILGFETKFNTQFILCILILYNI